MTHYPLLTEHDVLYGFPGYDQGNSGTLSIINAALRQYFDQRGVLPKSVLLSALRNETLSKARLTLQGGENLLVNWSDQLTRNRILCQGDPSLQAEICLLGRNRLVIVTQVETRETSYLPQHLYPHGHWDAIRNYHSHHAIVTESEEEAHGVLARFQEEGWISWCLTHYRTRKDEKASVYENKEQAKQ